MNGLGNAVHVHQGMMNSTPAEGPGMGSIHAPWGSPPAEPSQMVSSGVQASPAGVGGTEGNSSNGNGSSNGSSSAEDNALPSFGPGASSNVPIFARTGSGNLINLGAAGNGGAARGNGNGGGLHGGNNAGSASASASGSVSPSERMDDLMARLTTLSSAYQTGRGVAASAVASGGAPPASSSTPSANAPPAGKGKLGEPAAVALVPHIVLDRVGNSAGPERSSKSKIVFSIGKSSASRSHTNKSASSHSADAMSGGAGGGNVVTGPLRTPPTSSPLVAPAIVPDSNNPAVSSFNPLGGARRGAPGPGLSPSPRPPVGGRRRNTGGANDKDEDGDGNASEVELAAIRPPGGSNSSVIGAGTNVGAFGDASKENQQLLAGVRSSSNAGALDQLGLGKNDTGSREWEDDGSGPDVFWCGVIPTRFRREFWAPLGCVVLMIAIAALVAVLLYKNLHDHELNSFRDSMAVSCSQRARLLVQTFANSQAAAFAMTGFFAVQQEYYRAGVWWPDSYFQMYYQQSRAPTFVDRIVFLATVTDAERPHFESVSGHPITDVGCLDAPDPADITDNNLNRSPFDFLYLYRCYPKNLTQDHVRNRFPFYFPYTYHYPNFTGTSVQPVNIDGAQLFPLQQVEPVTLTFPISTGGMMFSSRQVADAADVAKDPGLKGNYGIVSMVPLFRPGAVLSLTGNYTLDFEVNVLQSQGLVASVIRTREALKQAIESLDPQPMHVVLWDMGQELPERNPIPEWEGFITEYVPAGQKSATFDDGGLYDKSLNATVSFEYGHRNFRLDCIPTNDMVQDGYSSTPTLIAVGAAVLVGVCILMLACGWLILNVRRSNSRAQLLAEANAGKNLALELLAEAKELADRANKSKSDFLAFLCHELRNPLHAISAMVEFLHNDYFRSAGPSGRFTPSQPEELVQEHQRGSMHPHHGGGGAHTNSGSQEGSRTSPLLTAVPDGVLTMVPASSGSNGGGGSGAVVPLPLPPRPERDRERRRRSNSGINVSSSFGHSGAVSRRRRRVEAAECVTIINTQVTMMRSILDDFLDMSKIESGVLHFEKIGFELALLAKQCVQSLSSKCKEKGIRIRLRLNQVGLPRKGYADPTRIKQLILNLLSNAVKFTNEGAVELFLEAIPMTPQAALAAELPPEAFEWAFGESVKLEQASSAGGAGAGMVTQLGGPKGSKSLGGHTPSQGHSKAAAGANGNGGSKGPQVLVQRADGSSVPMAIGADEQKVAAAGETPGADAGAGTAGANASTAAPGLVSGSERPTKIILHIAVTDSGSGIAPSALPHLFQPYSQEKLSIMRTHGGTGLGLAIVKNIVAHMHGSIHVTTQQGKGSKFSLHLPIDCRKPGASSGGSSAAGDENESATNDAELQSTVMRLRALHHAAQEEEEDVIESHLMDKFDRSTNLHGGLGGGGTSGSGGMNSSGESDEGPGLAAGRNSRRTPLFGAAASGANVATPRASSGANMPAASWLPSNNGPARGGLGPQHQSRAFGSANGGGTVAMGAFSHHNGREPSSSSTSLSGSGGSPADREGGSSRSLTGPRFHDDVTGNNSKEVSVALQHVHVHLGGGAQQQSNPHSQQGTPGGNNHGNGHGHYAQSPPAQQHQQVEGLVHPAVSPVGTGALIMPPSVASPPGGAAGMMSPPSASGSQAVDLLTASATQELRPANDMLWPAGSAASAPASAEQRTRALAATPVLSLLLVDDAEVNLKILCKMLGSSLVVAGTKYRLHLQTASNGVDAMHKVEDRFRAHQVGYHAIMSDIVMPLADGFQFARMLREFELRVGMTPAPLVALTANALKADVDAYSAASFRWFVPKPFRRADLTQVLQAVLQETLHTHATPPHKHHHLANTPSQDSQAAVTASAAGTPSHLSAHSPSPVVGHTLRGTTSSMGTASSLQLPPAVGVASPTQGQVQAHSTSPNTSS